MCEGENSELWIHQVNSNTNRQLLLLFTELGDVFNFFPRGGGVLKRVTTHRGEHQLKLEDPNADE